MAQTKINGGTQIQSGTIPLAALVSGYAIPTANLVDGANFLKKDGSVTLTAGLNFGGFTSTNLGAPSVGTDVANKAYVDSKVNGLTVHPAVRAVAATNISITSPGATIDGVTLTANDRIFLIAQTTQSQNGPWVWNTSTSALTRPVDWAAGSSQPEGAYWITDPDGTTYKNTKFFTVNTGTITVDTTAVTFLQDASGTSYTANNGVQLTGSTFSLNYLSTGGLSITSNQAIVLADTTRGISTSATGVAITDASTGGMLGLSNASNHFTWTAMSGDVTIGNTGVTTVNNVSGTGFVKYTNFVFNETPTGTVNGSNTSFTLANTPAISSLELCLNGNTLEPGSGNDYTISGATITMLIVPQTGDKLRAYYLK